MTDEQLVTEEHTSHRREWLAVLRRQLVDVRFFIALVILVFVLGALSGARNPSQVHDLVAAFSVWAKQMKNLGPVGLIVGIFLRNATAVGVTLLCGIFFGIAPLFAALTNGLLVGYVFAVSPLQTWKLIPHGIFELPAVFIGWGLGVWCGMWLLKTPRWQTLKFRLGRSIRIYFTLIVPLLVVAAIIEGGLASLLFGTG